MQYIVLNTNEEYKIELIKNTAYLVEDQWDDWFRYSTMYDLWIINEKEEKLYMGKVKIGQDKMEDNQRRPNIPTKFNQLDEMFFSLGQSDYYYENIKKLGNDLRMEILIDLKDIAYNDKIFDKYIRRNVTQVSLMRDFTDRTVKEQFKRIAKGGARLTPYSFKYLAAVGKNLDIEPMELSFDVKPQSLPPTNIHVLIGRNGVGKTYLIRNMIKSIVYSKNSDDYGCFISNEDSPDIFSNVILVSFSAFDSLLDIKKPKIQYIRIGLPTNNEEKDLANFFVGSLLPCLTGIKKDLLIRTIEILKSDPIFNESGIVELCAESKLYTKEEKKDFEDKSRKLFNRLSSGHKIIILTVTKLIQKVEEKTLVFLDEPEEHLHPPLLASFVRALSELLIDRNGVAIIATHSPVILQEVPNKCVWKLRRNGEVAKAERLQIESFGGSIEELTSEVFGLEVTHSGYHKFLEQAVEKYGNYETIINEFNGQLGMEAKDLLKTLIMLKNEEENKQ
jgi:predicted ATPase